MRTRTSQGAGSWGQQCHLRVTVAQRGSSDNQRNTHKGVHHPTHLLRWRSLGLRERGVKAKQEQNITDVGAQARVWRKCRHRSSSSVAPRREIGAEFAILSKRDTGSEDRRDSVHAHTV